MASLWRSYRLWESEFKSIKLGEGHTDILAVFPGNSAMEPTPELSLGIGAVQRNKLQENY